MGVKELREAFNSVTSTAATCSKALLEYENANDTQWQILYFSGNYADGEGFVIKSDRIRPNGDVILAARETAERFMQQKRAAT